MQETGVYTVGKNVLLPSDDNARGIMERLKVGDRVLVKVHRARNPAHHALAFAVLQRIAEAKGVPVETVLTWLKVGLGRVDFVQLPNGKTVACPQSISFAAMPQDEFQRFWNEAWPLITDHILPDLPQYEVDEIRAIVASDYADTAKDRRHKPAASAEDL